MHLPYSIRQRKTHILNIIQCDYYYAYVSCVYVIAYIYQFIYLHKYTFRRTTETMFIIVIWCFKHTKKNAKQTITIIFYQRFNNQQRYRYINVKCCLFINLNFNLPNKDLSWKQLDGLHYLHEMIFKITYAKRPYRNLFVSTSVCFST